MTPLRAGLLSGLAGVEHGFGTRADGAWLPPAQTARLKQVHGNGVVAVSLPGDHGEGDALLTTAPGTWLEIRTADCVPLLLAAPARGLIGAVHAGWRGTAQRIAQASVEAMARDFAAPPEEIYVAIGPSIRVCCFEVGEEVAAEFPDFTDRTRPRPHVDLAAANLSQLIKAGVPPAQIEVLPKCTACDAAAFHSFRRDRVQGRMLSGIRLTQP